jgi:hypothetical protein
VCLAWLRGVGVSLDTVHFFFAVLSQSNGMHACT